MATFSEEDRGAKVTWAEAPAEFADQIKKMRADIIESASNVDDHLAEKYLNEEEPSLEEIKAALRKGVVERKFSLALCGTAFKNKGVQLLLDAVVDYLPSPLDVPAIEGVLPRSQEKVTRTADPEGPFCALVFKIATDPFVGVLNFIRVYSGQLKAGSYVYNARTGVKERVSRLLKIHANKREEIDSVIAGDIAAVVGIKDAITGDSLCEEGQMLLLEPIRTPNPVISTSVEAKNKADNEKLTIALRKMMQEDPSFIFSYNEETGQTEISGMGELHLEIIVDRLRREHKVEATQGKLKVAYKETIQKPVEVEGKYIKQSGGRGQYGHVWMKFEPLERGKGFEFVNGIVGGTVPREFIPSVEKGLLEAVTTGVLGGYPTVDVRATLFDGSYHDVDSSEMAFKVAASLAFKSGMAKASPVLLEPIMKVEVDTPEEYMGDVMGDLNGRRGRILGMEERVGTQIIRAEVPLGEMFGYSTELRSMSKGRAGYSMEFECYREVPTHAQDTILGKK
jgi:elongation factor G